MKNKPQHGGSRRVDFHGKSITWYNCSDCGCVDSDSLHRDNTLRPNNKFCDQDCIAYVLENNMAGTNMVMYRRPRNYKKWLDKYWAVKEG